MQPASYWRRWLSWSDALVVLPAIRRAAPDAVQMIDQQLHRRSRRLDFLIKPVGWAESPLVHAPLQVGQVAEHGPNPLVELLSLFAREVA